MAEVCAIQSQAQEVHEASGRRTHRQKRSSARIGKGLPAHELLPVSSKDRELPTVNEAGDGAAGSEQSVAPLVEVLLQALRPSAEREDGPRDSAALVSHKGQHVSHVQAIKGRDEPRTKGMKVPREHSGASQRQGGADVRDERVQSTWSVAESSHNAAIHTGKLEGLQRGSAAALPEATISSWLCSGNAVDGQASDRKAGQQLSAAPVSGKKAPHPGVSADSGKQEQLLSLLQAELRLYAHRAETSDHAPALKLQRWSGAPGADGSSRLADASPTEAQRVAHRHMRQGGNHVLAPAMSSAGAPGITGVAINLADHSQRQQSGRPGWDGSVLGAKDLDRLVKTRSGLTLRSPVKRSCAAGARPPSAEAAAARRRPSTAATAAGSLRPASRGTAIWSLQSASGRRPQWDDRFILPQLQSGRRQEDSVPSARRFRASTPARVLKEVGFARFL